MKEKLYMSVIMKASVSPHVKDIEQLFTEVEVASGGYLPSREVAKYYSPPSSRGKTKWLLSVYCHK